MRGSAGGRVASRRSRVLLDRPDPTAPVSNLHLFGRKQDLAFEREAGHSAKQRNHVRFWRDERAGDAGFIP